MRYWCLVCSWALTFAIGPASAQDWRDTPDSLSQYVAVVELEEHRVVIAAPYGFGETQSETQNLYEWANWVCQFYHRTAVGPLSITGGVGQQCDALALVKMGGLELTEQERAACPQEYLFACAIN